MRSWERSYWHRFNRAKSPPCMTNGQRSQWQGHTDSSGTSVGHPCWDVMVQSGSCETVRNWIDLTHTFNLYFDHEKKMCFQITEAARATQCTREMENLAPENVGHELELWAILHITKYAKKRHKERESLPESIPGFLGSADVSSVPF